MPPFRRRVVGYFACWGFLKHREEATLIETTYAMPFLSYNAPYDTLPEKQPAEKKVANLSSHQGKEWWSQRDLNPCLSLERAPS